MFSGKVTSKLEMPGGMWTRAAKSRFLHFVQYIRPTDEHNLCQIRLVNFFEKWDTLIYMLTYYLMADFLFILTYLTLKRSENVQNNCTSQT